MPDSADNSAVVAEPSTSPSPSRRRTLPLGTQFDFWLDLVLLVITLADYSFRFTGLTWHEWIGVAFVVTVPVHITQHWDWIVRTTKRLVKSRRGRETVRWVVDLLIMPTLVLCVASGLIVSKVAMPKLGIHTKNDSFWLGLHTTTADITIALAGLHVALNWRWIVTTSKRIVRRRATAVAA